MPKELDSWMLRTVKKYEQEHPDKALKVKKTETRTISECDYCKGIAMHYIPFSDNLVYMDSNKIKYGCDCGRKVDITINYCPMCGRKVDINGN